MLMLVRRSKFIGPANATLLPLNSGVLADKTAQGLAVGWLFAGDDCDW